jgi:hypothetical protein
MAEGKKDAERAVSVSFRFKKKVNCSVERKTLSKDLKTGRLIWIFFCVYESFPQRSAYLNKINFRCPICEILRHGSILTRYRLGCYRVLVSVCVVNLVSEGLN